MQTLSAAFFDIFEYLKPFFAAGGRMLLCVPNGELSTGILDNVTAWSEVIREEAKSEEGELRIVFCTEYQSALSQRRSALPFLLTSLCVAEDGPHVKELLVVAPGGAMVEVQMTSNLTSAGLGMKCLGVTDMEVRRAAPQSGENMRLQRWGFDDPLAVDYVDGLAEHWLNETKLGRVMWNVPALHEIYSAFRVPYTAAPVCLTQDSNRQTSSARSRQSLSARS